MTNECLIFLRIKGLINYSSIPFRIWPLAALSSSWTRLLFLALFTSAVNAVMTEEDAEEAAALLERLFLSSSFICLGGENGSVTNMQTLTGVVFFYILLPEILPQKFGFRLNGLNFGCFGILQCLEFFILDLQSLQVVRFFPFKEGFALGQLASEDQDLALKIYRN